MGGSTPIRVLPACEDCKIRRQNAFCQLPLEARAELDRIKTVRSFSPGEELFHEGKPVDEVMIVCRGAAILTFSSSTGNTVMLGMSQGGEVLGLSAAFTGRPHEGTAQAIEQTTVSVIRRADFISFLARVPAAAFNAGPELSRKVNRAYDKIRLIGSGFSVRQRVAAWLLLLHDRHDRRAGRVPVALTHERIAQLLGVSRESVTRAFSDLKRRGIIAVRGIQLRICDRDHLESMVLARRADNPTDHAL